MNYAILLAGGTGDRIGKGEPKQYIRAGGYMMVTYAIKPLLECERTDSVYVVAERSRRESIMTDAVKMGLDAEKIAGYAKPGANRQGSILNGLNELISHNAMSAEDTVLIHDAARPFLSVSLLYDCYEALDGHDGVMPVLPMKDTVYLSESGRAVSGLTERGKLFAGQAPELFRLKAYYEANAALLPDKILQISGASEPAVMAGMDIAVIPGDENNYKVTTVADLERFIKTIEVREKL